MYCKDCEYSTIRGYQNIFMQIDCKKYGITVDTTNADTRQCIENDYDVLWRAGFDKRRNDTLDNKG